ncbi:MAG TPA: FAD:protein FMN transferase [Planctomycetota bacterium]|jgi:thiamine biosynthesis lipoprotein
MMKFCLFLLALCSLAGAGELSRYEYEQPIMGTRFRIVLYSADEAAADAAAQAAFDRIVQLDKIMSDYKESSELMLLCAKAGGPPVKVSTDLFEILQIAKLACERSDGTFDVTVGPLVKLWRISRRTRELPPPAMVAQQKELVGSDKMILNAAAQTVQLTKPGMQLDLGGIGKGFANEKALEVLKKRGITRAMVVGGGEMTMGDPPPDAKGWVIGIAQVENPEKKPVLFLSLSNCACSTSGDAEQHVEINGVSYAHIVDPRTGLGMTGHFSSTIVSPTGSTSEWLAKALCLLGPEKAVPLVDSIDGAAGRISQKTPDGIKVVETSRWKDVPKTEAKK